MRVLLMPESYPPVLGGLQNAARMLAEGLARAGHEPLVVTNRFPRSLPARERLGGVELRRMLFLTPRLHDALRGRPDLPLAALALAPLTAVRMSALLREFRPDVVNLHYPLSQIPFVLRLRRSFRFRLVVSLHGDERVAPAGLPAAQLEGPLRAVLREADAVTACSRALLERYAALEPAIGGKSAAVHNGIDGSWLRGAAPARRPRPYVLASGRLTRMKGFDLLLEAFAAAGARCPGLDLLVAGDGEERAALERRRDELGLAGRVEFLGRVQPAGIAALLAGCEFVAVPSRFEPFGLVALEAAAAGRCVLGTLGGGLEEFLDPRLNLLVAPEPGALAEGLARLHSERESLAARGRANQELAASFTPEAMVAGYLRAFAPAPAAPA